MIKTDSTLVRTELVAKKGESITLEIWKRYRFEKSDEVYAKYNAAFDFPPKW